MQVIIIVILVTLGAGVAAGIQAPVASMISQRMGILESVFLIHLGGALAALIPLLLFYRGGKLAGWTGLPWYVLVATTFGIIIVSAMSFSIPQVGAASALLILIVGQLIISVLLDHFGLLEVVPRPLEIRRIAGILIVIVGVWLTIK